MAQTPREQKASLVDRMIGAYPNMTPEKKVELLRERLRESGKTEEEIQMMERLPNGMFSTIRTTS